MCNNPNLLCRCTGGRRPPENRNCSLHRTPKPSVFHVFIGRTAHSEYVVRDTARPDEPDLITIIGAIQTTPPKIAAGSSIDHEARGAGRPQSLRGDHARPCFPSTVARHPFALDLLHTTNSARLVIMLKLYVKVEDQTIFDVSGYGNPNKGLTSSRPKRICS